MKGFAQLTTRVRNLLLPRAVESTVAHRDNYRHDPRRYLVVTPRLALYSGVYRTGEVITEDQVGSARDHLLQKGLLVATDFDLAVLARTEKLL